MSSWLLSAISVGYFWTALDLAFRGQYPAGVMFGAYGIANICLILMTK